MTRFGNTPHTLFPCSQYRRIPQCRRRPDKSRKKITDKNYLFLFEVKVRGYSRMRKLLGRNTSTPPAATAYLQTNDFPKTLGVVQFDPNCPDSVGCRSINRYGCYSMRLSHPVNTYRLDLSNLKKSLKGNSVSIRFPLSNV